MNMREIMSTMPQSALVMASLFTNKYMRKMSSTPCYIQSFSMATMKSISGMDDMRSRGRLV